MLRKIFRQMLITQIVSATTVTICMLVDSIMIGRFLGMDSMTAYGLATPVLLVFAAFGSMLSAGIQVMCGKTMGAGDREGTNACYSASLVMAGIVAAVGLALVLALSGPLTTVLGGGKPSPDNPVYYLTQDYLRGFIIGAPAFIFAQIMVPYMQIAGKRTILVAAVLAMTIGDVVFDILNVFVFHGGTFGMGLASSISYYVAFAIGITYFIGKKCMFRFRRSGVTGKTAFEIIKYGIPTVINQISLVALVFLLNKVLLHVGGNAGVAAYSVISSLGNICYCVGSGVASVSLTLSSLFYEDEDRTQLYQLLRIMLIYAVVLDVVLIALIWLVAPLAVRLFVTEDPVVFELAKKGLRLFSLSLLSSALNTSLKNYYQGVNRTPLTEAISVLQNFLLTALYALILSGIIGTDGVWLSFVLGETTTLLLVVIFVLAKFRKKGFAETFSLLPDDFGVAAEDLFERTIRDSSEITAVSEAAGEFCAAHGDSQRDSMLLSLCIEEMTANTVEYGFSGDSLQHLIELRLFYKDGERVVRLRDNCINFDPVRYLELHQSDDPAAHIGIRMVMKMVKEANYMNSLGLNNLTLVM